MAKQRTLCVVTLDGERQVGVAMPCNFSDKEYATVAASVVSYCLQQGMSWESFYNQLQQASIRPAHAIPPPVVIQGGQG